MLTPLLKRIVMNKFIVIDMDLCCLIDSEERLSASDLVTMVGDLLERGVYKCNRFGLSSLNLFIFSQRQNST